MMNASIMMNVKSRQILGLGTVGGGKISKIENLSFPNFQFSIYCSHKGPFVFLCTCIISVE